MDCVDEVTGGGVVGALAPAGGNVETDCAEAAAATPTSKPAPRMVDFSKLGIAFLQLSSIYFEHTVTRARSIGQMIIVHRTDEFHSFWYPRPQPAARL
jgi:hypothetical protein